MLEEIVAEPTETPRDFAAKAQTAIAAALKVPPLTHRYDSNGQKEYLQI